MERAMRLGMAESLIDDIDDGPPSKMTLDMIREKEVLFDEENSIDSPSKAAELEKTNEVVVEEFVR